MTIQMPLPSTAPATFMVGAPAAPCPTLAPIDRDAGEMLLRAVLADHLLIESAELGYLEAQARNLVAAARSTCAVRRAA